MKKILEFFLENKFAIIFSILIIGIYLFATLSGNRICDCEKTEKERNSGRTRFYNSNNYQHK
jgi:hypothetical protein